jgi:hypothetical protein
MLSGLILAAMTTATFPPAGVYRYTASMGGQTIGSWSVNIVRDTTNTEIDESSTATVMGMNVSAAAALLLGPDLSPVKYSGNYRTPTQNPSVSVDLSADSATAAGALTSQPQRLALAAGSRHFVVIEPGLLAGLFALPAQLGAWKESTVTWITPATAQAQSLTVTAAPSNSRPADVPAADAVLAIDHPVAVTIWYDPGTLAPDEISVPSQNAVLRRIYESR